MERESLKKRRPSSPKRASVIRFIATERAHYPVALLCRLLQVSRRGFYAAQQRSAAPCTLQDETLRLESPRSSRRVAAATAVRGCTPSWRVRVQRTGRKRVARLMRGAGLRALERSFWAPLDSARFGLSREVAKYGCYLRSHRGSHIQERDTP
jgi:hypothetical protein